MKNMNKKAAFLRCVYPIMGLLLVIGCKKMDFNYKQFIKDGETVYIGRPDSLIARSGDGRIALQWLLMSDPKIAFYKIYWNNRQDSMGGPLRKTENIDTVTLEIDGLSEKTHEFEVFHFDQSGHSSIKSTVVGKVYGDKYKNSLINRAFNSIQDLGENRIEISWAASEVQLVFSEIRYFDMSGKVIRYISDRFSERDTLAGFPADGVFELRSAFKPDSLAIDTFYTSFEEFKP